MGIYQHDLQPLHRLLGIATPIPFPGEVRGVVAAKAAAVGPAEVEMIFPPVVVRGVAARPIPVERNFFEWGTIHFTVRNR